MPKIVLISLALLVLAAACAPAPAEPTATLPPANTATVSPTEDPNATPIVLREFNNSQGCCAGNVFPDGAYRIPAFLNVSVSIEKTDYWRYLSLENRNVFAIVRGTNAYGDADEWMTFVVLKTGVTEEEFQAVLLAMPEWNVISGPTDVTVGAFSGWQIDGQAKPNPNMIENPHEGVVAGTQEFTLLEDYFETPYWFTSTPEAFTRIIALHVGTHLLVIGLESDPERWEPFLADTRPLLDSLKPIK